MEAMVKKYQQKFRKVRDEMSRWDELQSRLISQFNGASSIIQRLQVLQDSKNYGSLNCVAGIGDGLLRKQLESLEVIFLSLKRTMEEFHGIVFSIEKIHRDGRQQVKGGSNQPSAKQLQLRVGVKPTLADCLDGLMVLYDMHHSEYLLKASVVSALSTLTLKPSASDLCALQQLLIDQPNIPKDEGSNLNQMADSWDGSSEIGSQSDESFHFERVHLEPIYDAFVCPLTKQVMSDPVTLENGQTFEREAIEKWFRECKESGRKMVCPLTLKELKSTDMNPSIALRNTIEEWTARNEAVQLDLARRSLNLGSSETEILHALKYVEHICQKSRSNKHIARSAGLIPLIVDMLKSSSRRVRCKALETLRIVVEEDAENKEMLAEGDIVRTIVKFLSHELSKEREEAVSLLHELSKSETLCEKIGSVNGAILILVGMTSSKSENLLTVEKAEKTLENLEKCENNVRQMAENGRLQPLLTQILEVSVMEAMVKKYQQKFRKVRDEMSRWDELQSRLISQFNSASSIIQRLQVLQDSKNYGSLNCVAGIGDGLLRKQLESLEVILLSLKRTMEEFHGIVFSIEKIHRDGRQQVKGGSNQPSAKQLQLRVGVKPTLADCLDGLMVLYDMHHSEYLLKASVVSALSTLTLKPSASDLCALQQLLIDQPNIPKDEVQSIFDIIFAEEIC
nr:isoform 2 of u-box domain-containing protein 44 [Quercus suber]